MNRRVIVVVSVLLLAVLACTIPGVDVDLGGGGEEQPPPPPPDQGAPQPPPAVGGQCDSRTTQIQANVPYGGHINATDQDYPANCTYYCLWIPGGTGQLQITLSSFTEDLDLYVGYGDFDSVFGADIEEGSTFDWKSNEFGLDPEQVNIPNPATDAAYYVEVCSYDSTASDFQLQATAQ